MKKLIVLIMTVMISIIAVAQETKYELYRCTNVGISVFDKEWSKWEEAKANIVIRNNLTDAVIEINSSRVVTLNLIEFIAKSDGVDEDGDKYTIRTFRAYDQDGMKCEWTIYDYPDLLNINFLLLYKDTKVYYECVLIQK